MTLRAKLGLLLVATFLCTTAAVLGLQALWINHLVIHQTTRRVEQNIRSAWTVLELSKCRLEHVVRFLSSNPNLQQLARTADASLPDWLTEQSRQWGMDMLLVTDANHVVLGRAGTQERGDRFPDIPLPLLSDGGGVSFAFIRIPHDVIALESPVVEERCYLNGVPVDAMVLVAAYPMPSPAGGATVYLVSGFVLNRSNNVVDQIQETLFENRFYDGHRAGTATIFMGPERIATTVLLDNGGRAIGTRVSDEVAEQVLVRGEPWTGRAWVVSDWYLSRYDPIRDPNGRIIGMLYIGELERIYTDLRRNTLLTNTAVLVGIMAVAFIVMLLLMNATIRQVAILHRATVRFANGDFSARAKVRTRDETGQLADAFNDMVRRIEISYNEQLRQQQEVESANRNYMDTLSFVAHEFRGALGTALFNVHLLLRGSYGALLQEQREGVSAILNSLNYLDEITERYLQLSRIERGQFNVHPITISLLNDVVEPIRQNAEASLQNRGVNLTIKFPSDLKIYADPTLLRVVYGNLIGNAVKYGRMHGQIVLDATMIDGQVEMSVWNDGSPIAPDLRTHIFEKFQRFDAEGPAGRAGAGLGLFIVRQIIERHGGSIRIESGESDGVRFVFTLPFPREELLR